MEKQEDVQYNLQMYKLVWIIKPLLMENLCYYCFALVHTIELQATEQIYIKT